MANGDDNGNGMNGMLKASLPTIIAAVIAFAAAWGLLQGRITALEKISDKWERDHDAITKMSGDHEALQQVTRDHATLEKTVTSNALQSASDLGAIKTLMVTVQASVTAGLSGSHK